MSTKPKWQPPPPQLSPKILNLPTAKTRRKKSKNAAMKPPKRKEYYKGKLESLFDQEREFSRTCPAVVLANNASGVAAEKWRFQVEMLRAECNFLRMEREFALKKLERNKIKMERTLHSAVNTLLSGKKKIYEGENVGVVLQEEIEELAEKLEEIQRSYGVGDHEFQKCSNFDKKTAVLQRKLEKLGGLSDEKCTQQTPEMAETSHGIDKETIALAHENNLNFSEVEVLRMKMEGVSKGMLDRMEEEYGSMLSTTGTSSVASSSASTSMRIDYLDSSCFSTRQQHQETVSHEEKKCSGRCKYVVRRIVEQVRAETEQWSQMQDMLAQVRSEMEELQNSRDFWEGQALTSDNEIHSLQSSVEEWRVKALEAESKAKELETEVSTLRKELEKSKPEAKRVTVIPEDLESSPLTKKLEKEKHKLVCNIKQMDLAPISLGKQLEKEKRIYFRRVKEKENDNHHRLVTEKASSNSQTGFVAHRRTAFRDIGNV
ncbi:myosin-9 [Heracleum sosnowskyi]|uniref:Myosin-9 n=1 Tax=Heracleum sosnowskyi TaxID=360622 RepID=A0AAD8IRL2_9APIA|nr:myosin-9 [Heracleum sosnowskyi]